MGKKLSTLNNLEIGTTGIIEKLNTYGNERRRLLDLGLVKNTKIEALYKSPTGDPVAYDVRGSVIALRNQDAKKIIIYKEI